MAMLSLGKRSSSKAHLLLVLFTGLGRTDLNYLRFPPGKYNRNQEGECVCKKVGRRMEDRNEEVGDTETEKEKKVSNSELLHH